MDPARSLGWFFSSWLGWLTTLSFAGLGAYLLVTHTGHVLSALPYLLLLACPLIHLFVHGRHHDHKSGDHT